MAISTTERLFDLATPLGEDALLVESFEGHERLSEPFRFHLTLASEQEDIKPSALLGQRVTLRVYTEDGERHWTGWVSSFERAGEPRQNDDDNHSTRYVCDVVPWFWFLQLHEDSRIFQNQSIPRIVEALFKEFSFSDYELHLTEDYPDLVYCTQYRETTFNFISRLLERAGIHYFFRHEEDAEIMVLTDNRDNNPRLETATLPFHQQILLEERDGISWLSRRFASRTGRYVSNDYDFTKPGTDMRVSINSLIRVGNNAEFERYRHPGGYAELADGDQLTRVEIEAEEVEYETLEGASNVRTLTPGYVFELEDHPIDAMNEEYLVVSVEHSGTNNLGDLGGERASTYGNRISVIPHRVTYRAPQRTPRARVNGPQTAVVAGPKSEEIYTDEYGRIKVHFFWDRRSHRNEKSSCWLRVAQVWAGRQWGAMFIPRIGQEVIVDFLDGDPDRPIVVGSVYNADNMPPYALPAEQTKSTIKTMSSKGGEGFNEIRFEDKKGEEQLFVNAQKDMDLRVGNDRRAAIGNDDHLVVERDRLDEIKRHRHEKIKQDRVAEIGGDDHLKITGMQAVAIAGSQSVKVDGGVGESFKSHSESVSQSYYLKAGMNVVLEAGAKLSLKVGGSFIDISAGGIYIQAPMVMINSGGGPASGSAASLVSPMQAMQAALATRADPGQVFKGGGDGDEPTHDPTSEENQDKTHYIEVQLLDEEGQPVTGERVKFKLPNGKTATRSTDQEGVARVARLDPGNCEISFPGLDDSAWE
ncbi:hypothetical protein CDO46_06055 [Pigmentiphaga sp. NML030171]|uniref:type VI secretion system tip protein TssI/VgrG n=1 Tax=Pigmentiphaga sp. NML030171 TaxID=2008676 RepID=UPI000B417D94|nr:type VI secretion system tip protein TssI/VgrG [Pigmentiphaga sp. NML030171]OVZ65507.1 hypothetical protein CDO46_06055 [Pigmentiphaga sp. NML030171]